MDNASKTGMTGKRIAAVTLLSEWASEDFLTYNIIALLITKGLA